MKLLKFVPSSPWRHCEKQDRATDGGVRETPQNKGEMKGAMETSLPLRSSVRSVEKQNGGQIKVNFLFYQRKRSWKILARVRSDRTESVNGQKTAPSGRGGEVTRRAKVREQRSRSKGQEPLAAGSTAPAVMSHLPRPALPVPVTSSDAARGQQPLK